MKQSYRLIVQAIITKNMAQHLIKLLVVLALLARTYGSPVPEEKEEETEELKEVVPHAYSVPNSTWDYSTIEQILEEVAENKREQRKNGHAIQKRALGCASTSVAYGSATGTAFVDFTGSGIDPWPCGVDITEIRIKRGLLIDAIQVKYRTVDNVVIQRPRRGGPGGGEQVIRLQNGERITGVSGLVCNHTQYGAYIRQLLFFSEKQNGQKVTYGPYGGKSSGVACSIFGVNGKINSIFGRVRSAFHITVLGAIGFYYEDESRYSQHAYEIQK